MKLVRLNGITQNVGLRPDSADVMEAFRIQVKRCDPKTSQNAPSLELSRANLLHMAKWIRSLGQCGLGVLRLSSSRFAPDPDEHMSVLNVIGWKPAKRTAESRPLCRMLFSHAWSYRAEVPEIPAAVMTAETRLGKRRYVNSPKGLR
jgi:hypothetical protein